jgi:hypothetical protein
MNDSLFKERLALWDANYKGETPISQFVLSKSKNTYKGDVYIPWSVMLHALYTLDPDATVEKVPNMDGGYVHSDVTTILTTKDGVDNRATIMSHMVKVKVTYKGVVYEDIYPVQDKDYSATKVYDQNMVNKALQRCMTRVASLATGIGWHMYESGDAQFDGPVDETKPVVRKDLPNPPPTVTEVGTDDPVSAVAKLLYDNRTSDKIVTLIKGFNVVLSREYKDENNNPISIDLTTDTEDTIRKKVAVVKDPSKMLKSLTKTLGGT